MSKEKSKIETAKKIGGVVVSVGLGIANVVGNILDTGKRNEHDQAVENYKDIFSVTSGLKKKKD